MPSENARGGHANHTPTAAGITTNEDPWSKPPPPLRSNSCKTRPVSNNAPNKAMNHTPATTGYRLNHPPNEPPLWEMTTQHAKEHPPDETQDQEHMMWGPRDPR
ncbi:hypothetical protein BS47DRAFT_1366046 [Hydnum rufescens UP504]|uniref:Uncharacterized protein n=1 Tax=Hydnum rufescens UP504 TaxID=1448309 RepID=A0A9P6DNS2_9AGAM|nr:hypothetical protein BS47DRAFT_1366046 [Hydnum rufescens UP504]